MVVWQGITEGGTAVPVQITEEGKVVAIGEAGPQGPEGPRGPEGPPGQTEWPPNPIEGAFLVWLNGEPTWYTEQPIPTPPGTAGPITGVSDNALLLFGSDVDQNIFFKGVQVYAVNADGSSWDGGGIYNTTKVWSQYLTADGGFTNSSTAQDAFDGNLSTSAQSQTTGAGFSTSIDFIPEGGLLYTGSVKIYSKPGLKNARINGGDWATFSTEAVLATGSGTINSIEVTAGEANAGYDVCGYEVDGKILLDPLVGPYPTGQISTVANNSVLLSRVQGVWAKNLYMKADEGAQAAWLISKNRNGTILR